MIALVLVAAAAIGWWGWQSRDARTLRFGDVAAVVAALVALKLFSRGEALPAVLALVGAGWWYWFRSGGRLPGRGAGMTREEARRLLDVGPAASAEEVRAAHRRLVARVHPDAGGSADLAARVNAARDALLGR